MKTYFMLSAFGKDRPGIVAEVAEVVYQAGGNIEDSSMGFLRSHFALLLLFSLERGEEIEKLSSGLKRLEREKNLTVSYSPITVEEARPRAEEKANCFKITTSGVDHTGIVFRVCRLLADHAVNIVDMKTHRVFSAESGTPLFEMDIDVDVPPSASEQGLRRSSPVGQ